MTIKNGDMPAMPTKGELKREIGKVFDYQTGNFDEFQFTGMTKREQFAMAAMQGSITADVHDEVKPEFHATFAIKCADALLKALEADND